MKAVADPDEQHTKILQSSANTPTQASMIAITQGPDRQVSPTKQERRTPSNFMKALKEAINELHDGISSI